MDFDTQMESNSHGIDNIGLDFTDLEDFILHDHPSPSKIIHGKSLITFNRHLQSFNHWHFRPYRMGFKNRHLNQN